MYDDGRGKFDLFYRRGQAVAESGNFEYAIEMLLQAIAVDPDNVDGHQELRWVGLKRKAAGGGDLSFMEKMKLSRSAFDDPVGQVVRISKLLAYDPANTAHMAELLRWANAADLPHTATWIEQILRQANDQS